MEKGSIHSYYCCDNFPTIPGFTHDSEWHRLLFYTENLYQLYTLKYYLFFVNNRITITNGNGLKAYVDFDSDQKLYLLSNEEINAIIDSLLIFS
jgi:hypothetical protein